MTNNQASHVVVTFQEEGHRYFDNYGREYLSVTTLLKERFHFDGPGVAEKVSKMKSSRYYGMTVPAILKLWENIGEVGTEVHGHIEEWILNGTVPPQDHKCRAIIEHFTRAKWKGRLQSETIVWNESLFLAGSVDLIEDCGDYVRVWDMKTSRKIDDEKLLKFSMQMNIYRPMVQEKVGKVAKVGGIIWLEDYINNPSAKPKILAAVNCQKDVDEILKLRKEQLCPTSPTSS